MRGWREGLGAKALDNSIEHLENPKFRICNFTSPDAPRRPGAACVHQSAVVIHLNRPGLPGTPEG